MTLAAYILKRNGVPMGAPNSLRNMLKRSLGAKDFRTFWNHWNPIFGYFLAYKIFKPLKKASPEGIALLLTFVFCGGIHDLVTFLYRGETRFLFSWWFAFMGLAILFTDFLGVNFASKAWWIRATSNLLLIGICYLGAYAIKNYFGVSIQLNNLF
ncbi:acyltransferase [Algoriphagus sp. PAP.12]|uniref:acyltransferase n=1 Tax=Algoriphagus sp. PAP.12 TaxID=2996678 RepID=UPI00227A03F2|nr:acyltransferase [Algoriphagus sp. PAP.12]